jgi:hypothetical protein
VDDPIAPCRRGIGVGSALGNDWGACGRDTEAGFGVGCGDD